jgi:hypothetical protein
VREQERDGMREDVIGEKRVSPKALLSFSAIDNARERDDGRNTK